VDLVTTDITLAAQTLRNGGVVAIPTETVYGLGALATDDVAVARIFEIKGRPSDHPLIVHLSSRTQLADWSADVPEWAHTLADTYWPGPLTLVVPRSPLASDVVTGGLPTVGLRVPSHPIAQALLAVVGEGIAAPSANRYGHVSPTTSSHVVAELGPYLAPTDRILDGGASQVGVESTIVDCTGDLPHVLRPGAVTVEQIESTTGLEVVTGGTTRAPGTLPAHYAPQALVLVVDAPDLATAPRGNGLIAPAHIPTPDGLIRLAAPADTAAYARELYAALRRADDLTLTGVVVVPPGADGIGLAIRDRLRRAAYGSAQGR